MSDEKVRIIDNKKVLMSVDEFKCYQNLCLEYSRPNFKGESLFQGHFESDSSGFITFVKPPSQKYSSMEVFCFLQSLMMSQHIRNMYRQCDTFISESKTNLNDLMKHFSKKMDEKIQSNKS
jgi:hypothetical protein